MRRLIAIAALTCLATAAAGCVTPSIPIPPPDPALMSFHLTGDPAAMQATFEYPASNNYVGTVVFIYNRDKGVGIIEDAHADGSVGPTAPLAAELGNQVVISFQREDTTVSTCVRLREGPQSGLDYCSP